MIEAVFASAPQRCPFIVCAKNSAQKLEAFRGAYEPKLGTVGRVIGSAIPLSAAPASAHGNRIAA